MTQTKRDKTKKQQARRERRALRRYKIAFAFFRFIMTPFVRLKFRFRYDSLKKIKGPYLLLANHNMEMDPILMGIAAKRQLFFVASEHIARKGFGTWFLMRYFHPILHRKGKDGARSVMNILKTLRGGSSVMLFPEGNRSFDGVTCPIPEATGKMAKHAGVPVITYRMEGGYLSQPRFSTTLRRGRVTGKLIRVYSPEELKAMSDSEVNETFARDLYEDAYEAQERERIAFKGKRLAKGIESTLYRCPQCGAFGTLTSDNKTLRCTCGYEAAYDVYGYLGEHSMRDLCKQQREALRQRLDDTGSDAGEIFRDRVTVRRIGEDHKVLAECAGEIYADRDGVYVTYGNSDADGNAAADGPTTDTLHEIAIYSRNYIAAYGGDDAWSYDIRGDEGFNALKYRDLHTEAASLRERRGHAGATD